jgi:hypothetical protein
VTRGYYSTIRRSRTLTAHIYKNAMSMWSCQVKISVRPASHQHCATNEYLRMSRPRRRWPALTALRGIRSKRDYRGSAYFVGCCARALSLICPPCPLQVGTMHQTIGLFRAPNWAPRRAGAVRPSGLAAVPSLWSAALGKHAREAASAYRFRRRVGCPAAVGAAPDAAARFAEAGARVCVASRPPAVALAGRACGCCRW